MEKRLYRSTTNRVISGVCGGLGEYFKVDPVIFRIIFLLMFFGGTAGFWIYVLLMIVLPNDFEVTQGKYKKQPKSSFHFNQYKEKPKDVTPDREPSEGDWNDF